MIKELLLSLLLSATVAVRDSPYHGPNCLGPYCIDHDSTINTLSKELGPAPHRSSRFAPYCYSAQNDHAFLHLSTGDETPPKVSGALLSDFPNCLHMPTASVPSDLSIWKTSEGTGLGSSEQEVIQKYGKPSSQEEISPRWRSVLVQGLKQGHKVPAVGTKRLVYAADPKSGDLSSAEFGIRDGKVPYIWLSYSE